ncbi:hypothetical protein NXS19_002412 [Fusarium pseudograminearum]|nr:hypothetical protein NXS19_002412 [Fusarium pseudograminearum]
MDVDMSSGSGTPQVQPQAQQQQGESQISSTPGPPGSITSTSTSAGGVSFRRQRASRACETCHARKVRCDAASLGVPCTNCVAFQIECRIPNPKRKKTQGSGSQTNKDSDSDRGDGTEDPSPRPVAPPSTTSLTPRAPSVYHSNSGTPPTAWTEAQARKEEVDNGTYLDIVMKPKFTRAPITEAGRVAYLGESSNLTLLVHDRQGSADVVHYPLPENVRGSRARLTELDNIEIDILHQRGAFLLPPRTLCDELIDAYFKWVHPIVPSVLLAGTRACNNHQLMDANGSTTPAALTFYKRAKALYDANYEDDRVTIVQSLLLMGWYWEGPEDVTKNVFYWSRVATIVAQGSGMHRSVEQSQLSRADKRLWKRIWWSLFTRDRSVAVALGRPVHINLDDADVEMLTEDDFIEDEADRASEYPPDPIHVQFFLEYVKLCEIMGLVLSQQYSVASKGLKRNAIDLTHSDMALADWLQNCPKIVYWEMPRHHFWSALLHSNYYTTLCLLHRAHMPPGGSSRLPDPSPYPSRNIAFQAAAMITSIVENLAAHDQLRYCPAFVVYSLFSALIMHVYQMKSPVPSIQQSDFKGLKQNRQAEATKRKYDDMAIDFGTNTPQPQESYERSRPQTPSAVKTEPTSSMQPPPVTSPNTRQSTADTFMGGTNSRPQTRPATPFNPSFSVPPTPPDLYLVTRNSPNLSQSLWENFQPDQLFPDSASMPAFPNMSSPTQTHSNLDHNNIDSMPPGNGQSGIHNPQAGQYQNRGNGMMPQGFQGHANMWQPNLDPSLPEGQSPDSWSTASGPGQAVPTTLNVEDWFQFFGINGTDPNFNFDVPLG